MRGYLTVVAVVCGAWWTTTRKSVAACSSSVWKSRLPAYPQRCIDVSVSESYDKEQKENDRRGKETNKHSSCANTQ